MAFSKEILTKHIDHLIVIFSRICRSVLKVNAPKFIFRLNDIPCLGCVIPWYGNKPDVSKVLLIMDISRPTTTTEPRSIIDMFQYYGIMWPRRLHVLTPL